MKLLLTSLTISMTAGFAPVSNKLIRTALNADVSSDVVTIDKPIFDPLGLYPADAQERQMGLIRPLEVGIDSSTATREVMDPLGIYSDPLQLSTSVDMSSSLPFLPRPSLLDGSLPGDRGFDPFNFAQSNIDSLQWQRRAEIKHGRLAMLATTGWVFAELFHKDIAQAFNQPVMLASYGRVPSILNDGLVHANNPFFWIGVLAILSGLEMSEVQRENNKECRLNPGDWNFDPLNLGGKDDEKKRFYMEEAELFNGRLGMMAITGFAIQEWFLNSAVVDQVPIFFKPINVALEQLMNA